MLALRYMIAVCCCEEDKAFVQSNTLTRVVEMATPPQFLGLDAIGWHLMVHNWWDWVSASSVCGTFGADARRPSA